MIHFYTDEAVPMPRLRRRIVRFWLEEVARSYGREVGELSYQFCNDERILEVNREFLQHDYYTDIITFDDSHGSVVSGDLLISLDTVRSNAQMLGVPYAEELHRVLVHGLLHLCGLGDKTKTEAQIMRQAEDKALEVLGCMTGEGKRLFV
ncbi:rRNA maturation RNase YbeY [Porphyromonas sp. COT-239 OH1446]|uniref:rRNA maturation RNase YbeY n=1 Tax=Porphyromonas sp. COT-239 OH1446 TaxID=1515613 RepID=UPI00052C96A6|nr:rRNA maturation RNase YbeY [Porphyromonas sp. COT-239 OH1446]KGN72202.1 rRNA maturation factor [Porphyromonas sp. COT-239 OH1446]